MKKKDLIAKNRELLCENNELHRDNATLKEENKALRLAHKVSLIDSPNPLYMEMSKHKMLMEGEKKNTARLKQEVLDLGKKLKVSDAKLSRVLNCNTRCQCDVKQRDLSELKSGLCMFCKLPFGIIPDFGSIQADWDKRKEKAFEFGKACFDSPLEHLTISRLHLALKAVGLKMSIHNVGRVIDLVDLIVSRGPELRMDELTKLQKEWRE